MSHSGAQSDWWLVAKVRREVWGGGGGKGYRWVVDDSWSQRAFCTPRAFEPDVPTFMSPDCVV